MKIALYLIVLTLSLALLPIACRESETADPIGAPTADSLTAVPTDEAADGPTVAPTEASSETEAALARADPFALVEHPWQWASFTNPVEQLDVQTPGAYLIQFNEDGTVTIVGGCNNAHGDYTVEASALSINIGPTTLADCRPGSLAEPFITYLGAAARYFIDNGNLLIDLVADGGTMVLTPADNNAMSATGKGDLASALAVSGIEPLETCFTEPPDNLGFELDVAVDCGYVIVPEFYRQPGDKTLKIGFMRFNARQETAAAPLFILGGGPGQDMMTEQSFRNLHPQMLGGILDTRDIVLLNQRGVKHTEPVLDCPAYHALQWTAAEQGTTYLALLGATLQACVDDLRAEGIDFDAYNSVEIAADVNAARQALGYDHIVYYGASYGAQLGQHVMRDFPEMLESVVLDGANSLSRRSWIEDRALDAQWGLDNLAALCDADEACLTAYGNIAALVEEKFALLDDAPLPYTYVDTNDPTITFDLEVNKVNLATLIVGQFGMPTTAVGIPFLLTNFAPDVETLAEALGQEKGQAAVASRGATEGGVATLMHYAVVCSDDPVDSADDLIIDETVGEFARQFGESLAREYVIACDVLDVQRLPDATDENVTAAIPTLILAGSLDTSTPSYRSQIVADALSNDTFVVLSGRTHIQLNGANDCAGQIMTQFVLDPTASLDTACAEESSPYPFMLPDGSQSRQ